ncbi:MAG: hypothetical protein WD875_19470 [Pirellulales bacterium]
MDFRSARIDAMGKIVVYSSRDDGLVVIGLDDVGNPRTLCENHSAMFPTISADGSRVAAFIWGDLCLYDVESAALIGRLPFAGSGADVVQLAPDGSWLAAALRDGKIQVWRRSRMERVGQPYKDPLVLLGFGLFFAAFVYWARADIRVLRSLAKRPDGSYYFPANGETTAVETPP